MTNEFGGIGHAKGTKGSKSKIKNSHNNMFATAFDNQYMDKHGNKKRSQGHKGTHHKSQGHYNGAAQGEGYTKGFSHRTKGAGGE